MKNGKYPSSEKLSPKFLAMIDAGVKEILERSKNNTPPQKVEKFKRNIFAGKGEHNSD